MNASLATVTAPAAHPLFVVVTRVAGQEPSINVHYTADDAQDEVAESLTEYAKDRDFDARRMAKGWKGEPTPVTSFEIVTVTGAKAAEMIRLQDEIDFNSQDEAQSDYRSELCGILVDTFFA